MTECHSESIPKLLKLDKYEINLFLSLGLKYSNIIKRHLLEQDTGLHFTLTSVYYFNSESIS